jgi:hypothetical protein
MPASTVEDLSNDDLLVQLNELCEEVGWRLFEYSKESDREKLAEGASFAAAANRATKCEVRIAAR